jgi:hypothetical protein
VLTSSHSSTFPPLLPDPPVFHPLQTNPIRWSLSLGGGGGLSAFGAGYFDDAADVPGTPVLFFALRGHFRPEDATVELVKVRAPPSPATRPFLDSLLCPHCC